MRREQSAGYRVSPNLRTVSWSHTADLSYKRQDHLEAAAGDILLSSGECGLGSLHIGAPTESFSAANFRIT